MSQAQIIQEITMKLLDEASRRGYKPNYPLFRALTPEEVPAFRESAFTPEVCEVWHPVTRLQMIQRLTESLISQGEL